MSKISYVTLNQSLNLTLQARYQISINDTLVKTPCKNHITPQFTDQLHTN